MNIPSQSSVFRWRPACWLRVTGPDAASFLQGQFTNDIKQLAEGECNYGLWLNVKGKVLADSFVFRGVNSEAFWIGSYFSSSTLIRERLESHLIADEVTITDETDRWAGITLFPGDTTRLMVAPGLITVADGRYGFCFRGRRTKDPHLEWILPVGLDPDIPSLVDLPTMTIETVRRLRIEARIPAVPVDIGPSDLPNEGGLEGDAISYTKGCYLGQEVMARLKSMGQVRRKLLRVSGPASVPAILPVPLFDSSRQIGELRSAAVRPDGTMVGLALISLMHLKPETGLAFAMGAEPALRVIDLP